MRKDNIKVSGHRGTWYVIDSIIHLDRRLYLLEHEAYGDEAAGIIIDDNYNIILEDVWNGFGDYHEQFD